MNKHIEEMARKTHFRLYKVWENMKSRCYNQKHKSYHRYGGRGITVCNKWKDDFGAFEKWALENGYDGNAKQGQCTLDRIDNDKGYSPENCQWITIQENCNKTNFNLMYTHNGKTQSLADWSRELGIKYNCLLSRMHRNGFDFEQAIIPRKNGSRHLVSAPLRSEDERRQVRMIWMTKMENIVMNLTGCERQIANTVINTILEEDAKENTINESEWISVDERLPDNHRRVLVACEGTTIGGAAPIAIGSYGGGFWSLADADGTAYLTKYVHVVVTHWMPLPEPPKGGAE